MGWLIELLNRKGGMSLAWSGLAFGGVGRLPFGIMRRGFEGSNRRSHRVRLGPNPSCNVG